MSKYTVTFSTNEINEILYRLSQQPSGAETKAEMRMIKNLQVKLQTLSPDKRITKSDAGRMGGTVGGASTSDAKRLAVRENGKRGGRPLKPNADPARRDRYLRSKSL